MAILAKMARKRRMSVFAMLSLWLHFVAVVCGDITDTPWKETSETSPSSVPAPIKNLPPDKAIFSDIHTGNRPILTPWRGDKEEFNLETYLTSRRGFLNDNEFPRTLKSTSDVLFTSTTINKPEISNELPGDQRHWNSWMGVFNADLRSTSTSTTAAAKTAASTPMTSTDPATTPLSNNTPAATEDPSQTVSIEITTKVMSALGNVPDLITEHWRVRLAKLEKSRYLKRKSRWHKRPLKSAMKRRDKKSKSHQAKRRKSRKKKTRHSKSRRKRRDRKKTRSEKYNAAAKRKLGPEFVTMKSPRTTPTIVKDIGYRPIASIENRHNAQVSINQKYPEIEANRHKHPVTVIGDQTTLTPFISSTRAFNYLSKHDSRPKPKRWPVNLVLNEEIEKIRHTESPTKVEVTRHNHALTATVTITSDMTTLTPFISSTRAFDYLSKYDSRPKPKSWPVNLVLGEEIEQVRHSESPTKTPNLSDTSKPSVVAPTTKRSVVRKSSKSKSAKFRQRSRRRKAWWRKKKNRRRSRGFKRGGKRRWTSRKRNKGKKMHTYRGIKKSVFLSRVSYGKHNLFRRYRTNNSTSLTTTNLSIDDLSLGESDISSSNDSAHIMGESKRNLHLPGKNRSNLSTFTYSNNLTTPTDFPADNDNLSIINDGCTNTLNESGIYSKKIKCGKFLKIVNDSGHQLNTSKLNFTKDSENVSLSISNTSSFMFFNSTASTPNNTDNNHEVTNDFANKSHAHIVFNQTTASNNNIRGQTIRNVSPNSSLSFYVPFNTTQTLTTIFSSTPSSKTSTTTSRPSFNRWRQWANRKKKKKQKRKKKNRNRKKSFHTRPGKDGIRRGSLSDIVTTPTTTTTTKGPFITYKSAFDFLSKQKVIHGFHGNEDLRESYEINREISNKMCKLFKKRFVPTSIGGKCV